MIGELADAQHGMVAAWQLLPLGVTRRQIERRVALRRLIAHHRGVYAAGHGVRTADARRMAAILASGPGAVLAGPAAADAWGLRPHSGAIDVLAPRRLRPLTGVRRREILLPADEVTELRGMPITTAARTLLDLAGVLDSHRLRRAMIEAERRHLGDRVGLVEIVRRHPRIPGVGALRAILAAEALDAGATESELEIDFVAFAAAARLPPPRPNHVIGPFRVDAAWPAARLAVEVDSRAFHADLRAFEDDRRRDRVLAAAGWTVIRVTARQLREERDELARDLRALLARR